MYATRRCDGKQVMLKKIYPPEDGPHELMITQLFSSREFARDPRNHCVPLLDIFEMPQNGQKLMIMPFLRPFNNPRNPVSKHLANLWHSSHKSVR